MSWLYASAEEDRYRSFSNVSGEHKQLSAIVGHGVQTEGVHVVREVSITAPAGIVTKSELAGTGDTATIVSVTRRRTTLDNSVRSFRDPRMISGVSVKYKCGLYQA
jgi:hypothetical protein